MSFAPLQGRNNKSRQSLSDVWWGDCHPNEASMCDYSLHSVSSRPAKAGDQLVTTSFPTTTTRGFAAVDEPTVAVCLLPGTELAFEHEVTQRRFLGMFRKKQPCGKVARFRQVHMDRPDRHHDALEFPNGKLVLLTDLRSGQRATVLQLPVTAQMVREDYLTTHPIIDVAPVRSQLLDQ
jgi:hypothetical protein